jgi:hypothetical protein
MKMYVFEQMGWIVFGTGKQHSVVSSSSLEMWVNLYTNSVSGFVLCQINLLSEMIVVQRNKLVN